MSQLIPLGIAVLAWIVLHAANRRLRWFRLGELLFWDAMLLILIQLTWLGWGG
jgi:hypothetical protein